MSKFGAMVMGPAGAGKVWMGLSLLSCFGSAFYARLRLITKEEREKGARMLADAGADACNPSCRHRKSLRSSSGLPLFLR